MRFESDSDAHRTFRRMPKNGNPPDDWSRLLTQAKAQNKRTRGIE
jgi:hypothetical protein